MEIVGDRLIDAAAAEGLTADDARACTLAARDGLTVYFDGACPLCRREIALAKKLTGEAHVTYSDISSRPADENVTPDLTVADAMARFHVRRADGALASGAAAFLEMWTASPRLRFLKPLSRSRLAVSALDGVYALFLKVRPRLSAAVRRYEERNNRARRD
ncbi:MAG: thiol-disulfide oxidoreductase DCC family protein [Hyphomicrobium sp.]